VARNSDSAPIARLKKRMDFLRCAQGKRQNMSGLALQWQPGPETRIGFTVSKKNGNAVKRNRIRRRLKAAVADIGQAGFPSGDHVVVARPDALTLPYTTLIKSLKSSAEALARKGARPHMAENRKTTQDR
jgi:ribonuclease P protein component